MIRQANWQQKMVEQIDNSNHKSIRVEVEVKTGITIRETTKINRDQIAETEDNTDKTEVVLDMNKIIEEIILEET